MKRIDWLENIRKATYKRGFVCDCCKGELFDYPQTRVCARCEDTFYRNEQNVCFACGRKNVTEGLCLICKETPPAFLGISPFVYIGETARVINRIKNGERRLCCYYAEQMCIALLQEKRTFTGTGEELILLPVPMTDKRKRRRGYNQAQDLAEEVAERLREAGYTVSVYTDVLIKNRETPSQKHLSLRGRRENLRGVFHLAKRTPLKDKTVILIDDIMTTGITGDACAKLCKGAGAKTVYFLTVASAPEKPPEFR